MCSETAVLVLMFLSCIAFCFASVERGVESRGKKIGLYVYVADLIVKKIFVLKLLFAFVFWLVLHKAGYLLGWFVSYLKEKKEHHHEHYDHHEHYGHYHDSPAYGPYRRQNYGGR